MKRRMLGPTSGVALTILLTAADDHVAKVQGAGSADFE